MRYYLIVGEASGDLHASNLMRSLLALDPGSEFRYYGGDLMEGVGGELVRHYREMSYMGFIPVLLHLRTILRNMQECKKDILNWNPDGLILVDYPGFNLSIAKYIKKHSDIPVYYYISPKIWAWKEYRLKDIRRYVDKMLSILPFEVEYYQRRNYEVTYVGNPCVDAVSSYLDSRRLEGDGEKSIAIVAGSRIQEIKKNLGMMLKAASSFSDYRLVIAGAPNISRNVYDQYIPKEIDCRLEYGKTYEIIERSSAALVTSGTATLETALLGTPQVVCYNTDFRWLLHLLKKLVLKVRFVSLVNLICGREAVRELVASDMTVENVRTELESVLPGGIKRDSILKDYDYMKERLGPRGASERAAEIIASIGAENRGKETTNETKVKQ